MKPRPCASQRATRLLILGAALAALPAGAVELLPSAPGGLVSGDEFRLEVPRLPAGADEMEVYLSLDGGASYPIRLSDEEDPAGEIEVRVPDLPTAAARFLVRVGGTGASGRYERDLAVSEPFSIGRGGGSLLVPWADRGRRSRRGDRVRIEWRAEERSLLSAVPFEPGGPSSAAPWSARAAFPAGLEAALSDRPDPLAPSPSRLLAEGRGGEPVTPRDAAELAGLSRAALPGPLRL